MRVWILPLALVLAGITASGGFNAARADKPFALDASLSDPRWQTAERISVFTDTVTRTPAKSKTTAAVYYDDQNIYVAFWSEQTAPITATQTADNVGFGSDDYVGVGIDPSGNADRAYYFEISPIGTRFQQASENARYRPHWSGAAKVSGTRWTAILIIPLKAMRLPSATTQSWRVNFVRFVAQGTERQTWSYAGQMDSSNSFPNLLDARYWANLRDLRFQRSPFQPQPVFRVYGLSSTGLGRDQFVTPAGTQFTQNPRPAGLDLVYPFTGTMSFVGALNPDFSNVDADQQTITPQVFQRSLVEYRPFFAQGANYINNAATQLSVNEPPNLTFYSPSIGTFDRGFKVEGTYGHYQSLGLLEVRGTDETSGQVFDDVAFGFKHVLPGRAFGYWTNGVIANHAGIHDDTVELGIQARDLRTGWVGALFLDGERGTLIPESSLGNSESGFIDHQSPTTEALLGFRSIAPLYNPIDGYTQISDIYGPTASYSLFGAGPPQSILKDGSIYVFGDRYLDRSGAVHKADAGFATTADLRNDFTVSLGTTQTELRTYNGNVMTGYPTYADPLDQRYDTSYVGLGYRVGSPSPVNAQYSWGPFGDYYLHQWNSTWTRPLGQRYSLSLEYDGTLERFFIGPSDGQWLRRVSLNWTLDRNTTLSLALRDISGNGGFATPGNNFAAYLHRTYDNGNELYATFGSANANQTIDRFLVKYVWTSASP